ncbi:MAG: nicotinate-nucleotide diphosphorylase [Candidatus Sungiibacteriota bacterium]|uniref:Nicotinate-nucleotide diphosphorylase n=1 Tax=Candidatus Sungiibacteriota bacterium TaxID=2750080 RepID=A0A7T5UQK3_9BACT|nr:MAG: nicotinate-nucleotide diphosphorylase [Candidatus Sungbacteria bacterium]
MNELWLEPELKRFLLEDIGYLEIDFGVPARYITAEIVAGGEGVFCGGRFIAKLFNLLVPPEIRPLQMIHCEPEGAEFKKGTILASFRVNAEALRHGTRTVLNLLTHLTAIATRTREVVKELQNFSVTLLDTRKTTPGLRIFEKYAVRVGGASNHRMGRFDGILIKKEDIKIDGGIRNAVEKACRKKAYLVAVSVEIETLEELGEALGDKRVTHLLVDNPSIELLQRTVERCASTHIIEASGVGKLDLREVAATGVHYISLSSLILGAKTIKMKMRIVS